MGRSVWSSVNKYDNSDKYIINAAGAALPHPLRDAV